jgi:UDP-glucose 4-epimerase
MKNILVLGGGGFIGSSIVSRLLEDEDCNVTSADIAFPRGLSRAAAGADCPGRLRVITGDFTEFATFDRLGGGFDQVYMMSAIVGVNRTLECPEEVVRTNTLLTMNTLDWIKKNPVKRLLFASSSENYAGTSDLFGVPVPTPESVALCISDIRHPRFTYAMTKMHGECAFLHSAKSLGYDCVIVRYQNIIGPNMGFRHAIPHIVQRFADGEESPYKIYGGDQTRAFCYISDAVDCTIKAMNLARPGGEIFHVGNDAEITIEDVTREIGCLMGYTGAYQAAMTYPGSVARRCPDIRKSRQELGYEPVVHWKTAVALTVAWYGNFFAKGSRPPVGGGGFAPPEQFIQSTAK